MKRNIFNPIKIGLLIFLFVFYFISNSIGVNVSLIWDSSYDSDVIGYKIYYGTESHNYTTSVDVGNVSNVTITLPAADITYYFAARAYDIEGNESDFSNETSYCYVTTIKYTYLGMKIDYGTNIFNLNSKSVMMTQKDSSIPYFYRSSLLITNRPIVGIRPNDGNSYVYLGGILQYGTNLFQITTEKYDLMTLTNPPNYFYRGSLIITNRPF